MAILHWKEGLLSDKLEQYIRVKIIPFISMEKIVKMTICLNLDVSATVSFDKKIDLKQKME